MTALKLPAVDPAKLEPQVGLDQYYPSPFNEPCRRKESRSLGDAAGISQFGAHLTVLPPGTWSSQRHWHMKEDEFIFVLEGEVVLVTDDGEQVLTAGTAAGFPAGKRDGHHLINRSDNPTKFLEIGTRTITDDGEYSDIDMTFAVRESKFRVFHKNGEAY